MKVDEKNGINSMNDLEKKPTGRARLGSLFSDWEDAMKFDRTEIVCEGVGWIQFAHYKIQWRALINTVMNLDFVKVEEFNCLSTRSLHHGFSYKEIFSL
jgi:hypothetical protein